MPVTIFCIELCFGLILMLVVLPKLFQVFCLIVGVYAVYLCLYMLRRNKKRNMVNFYVKQIINILAIGKATGRKYRGWLYRISKYVKFIVDENLPWSWRSEIGLAIYTEMIITYFDSTSNFGKPIVWMYHRLPCTDDFI